MIATGLFVSEISTLTSHHLNRLISRQALSRPTVCAFAQYFFHWFVGVEVMAKVTYTSAPHVSSVTLLLAVDQAELIGLLDQWQTSCH